MGLTRTEREQIQDTKLKLQSAAHTLRHVDPNKVADFADIQECLQDADASLQDALNKPA